MCYTAFNLAQFIYDKSVRYLIDCSFSYEPLPKVCKIIYKLLLLPQRKKSIQKYFCSLYNSDFDNIFKIFFLVDWARVERI